MNFQLIRQAKDFAIRSHDIDASQKYNGRPYSYHLEQVAQEASMNIYLVPSFLKSDVIAAAWLHDTIEDARITYSTIKQAFGLSVAEIVFACTDDKGRNRKERHSKAYYDLINRTPGAAYVKLFDRVANVKFSIQNNSPQLSMYGKENADFIANLGFSANYPLVAELNALLHPIMQKI